LILKVKAMPTIQPFHHRKKKTKLSLELDHELAEQLKAYAGYYKQTHGADVPVAELTAEIIRQFIAADETFGRTTKSLRTVAASVPSTTAA
jgi:hypothetical protein